MTDFLKDRNSFIPYSRFLQETATSRAEFNFL